MQKFEATILGARGSVPVDGDKYAQFGGATACIFVRVAGQCIVLDAGTGLVSLPSLLTEDDKNIHIFISHPHADHLLGLPISRVLYEKNRSVKIYAVKREIGGAREQLEMLMRPPLWSVTADAFTADVEFEEVSGDIELEDVKIEIMEGNHPGGCTAYKINYGGKCLVYATDYEITDESKQKLIDFAKDCSLLICDGQYTENEIETRRGFGHSTASTSAKLALEANVEKLCIFHHDPNRTDEELLLSEKQLKKIMDNSFFAKRGEVISL